MERENKRVIKKESEKKKIGPWTVRGSRGSQTYREKRERGEKRS